MATIKPIAPDRYERILAIAALAMLAAALVALGRGLPQWRLVPWQVWPHVATILIALVLTPVMLLRRRGDRPHRTLGAIWMAAMFATALLSFNIRETNHGAFSLIHLLSAFTVVMVPLSLWAAHTHRVAMHRRSIRGLVTGALIVAGVFTLLPTRLLGHWLFG